MNDDGKALLDRVWTHLVRGVSDRRHPARHPTLATIGPEGPELRTLVLRRADREAGLLEMHTDSASPKVAHIERDPRVALHVWIPKERLQVRMRATAETRPGDPGLFRSLPADAQRNYGGAAPGTPITSDEETLSRAGDVNRFSVIACRIFRIDALILADPHQRAVFHAPQWTAIRVAP